MTESMARLAGLPTVTAQSGRVFVARPEAAFVFLFRDDEKLLLLRQPGVDGWRPVGGALEAAETVQEAAMHELREELGPLVRATLLGLAHAWTYRYDDDVQSMTSMAWVASYEGGDLLPGDDMSGSEWNWFAPDEVADLLLSVPEGSSWLLQRARAAYRTFRGDPPAGP